MRPPSFSFEPFRKVHEELKEEKEKGATVNTKTGYFTFPKKYIKDTNLEGRYIKWFMDTNKKALGWRIMESGESMEALRDIVQVKRINTGGTYCYKLPVRRVLRVFKFRDMNVGFYDLEIKKYQSTFDGIKDGPIYYVTLDDPMPIGSYWKLRHSTK